MKLSGILILVAVVVSVVSPVTAHLSISPFDGVKHLISLDVCNASGALMSDSSDIPLLYECPCEPVPFVFAEYVKGSDLTFLPSLYSIQIERPPKS